MEEKSFFTQKGVSVTSARFIVDGQTYAMNGVTSVKTGRKNPSRLGPIILGLVGLATLGGEGGAVFIGLLLLALAIAWWVVQKPELSVMLSSASGEVQALKSKEVAFIEGVVEALNNAIIHRG